VRVNSPAGDAGIRVGDKVVKINQSTPTSLDAAKKAIEEAKAAKRTAVLMQFERDGNKFFVGVPFAD
jgi:C-terminal processing protease CtpA/Prc